MLGCKLKSADDRNLHERDDVAGEQYYKERRIQDGKKGRRAERLRFPIVACVATNYYRN